MKRGILTICIPTYNNVNVLLKEVKEYLAIGDDRLYVKVNDNSSTDDTRKLCEELALKYDHFLYNCNQENLKSIPNWMLALQNAPSDYVLFTLDKDYADPKELPAFIDYLEKEKPSFGYIDLDINKKRDYVITPAGYDNVVKMAYLDKHPSGYFYRKEHIEKAINADSYKIVDIYFDFPFEIFNAELALEYPSTHVIQPIVINANIRKDVAKLNRPKKTLSYDESNIWYGFSRRMDEFKYYLTNAYNLSLDIKDRQRLGVLLYQRALSNVTTVLRVLMHNKDACEHYNVRCRTVSLYEMVSNINKVNELYKTITLDKIGELPINLSIKTLLQILRGLKLILKENILRKRTNHLSA